MPKCTVHLFVWFLAMVSVEACASGVTGYMSINGERIELTHGYATLEQDYFTPAQQQLQLLLVNKALKSPPWIDTADNKLHILRLSIGPDQFLRSLTLSDDSLSSGSISGIGIAQIQFERFTPTQYSGRLATDGVFRTGTDTIEVDASFQIQLDETWDIKTALAAMQANTANNTPVNAPDTAQDIELAEAVDSGNATLVSRLLEQGANGNFRHSGRSLLTWAADLGHTDVVRTLLEYKANTRDTDWLGQNALSRSIANDHKAIVELLLEADPGLASVEPENTTLGILAVQTFDSDMVRLLIDAGADFNLASSDGEFPIVTAVTNSENNVAEIVRLLGDSGVNMNPGESYIQPLYFAVENNYLDLAEALLQAGANPNNPTSQGNYPLFAAIGNAEMAALLLKSGADPDQQSDWGEVPIMAAIGQDAIKTVEVLLTYNANIHVENPQGYSALDIARNGERGKIVALLEQHESRNSATLAPATDSEGVTSTTRAIEKLPKIEFTSPFTIPGTSVAYLSGASVEAAVVFYNKTMEQHGWKQTSSITDFKTYATLQYGHDAHSLSVSVLVNGAQTMISLTNHGSLKVNALERYPGTTTVYEADSIGIYTTKDPVARVASMTQQLLEANGWQGEILVQQDDLHQLKMRRANWILDVMISVAPAQNNQTSIQYNMTEQ